MEDEIKDAIVSLLVFVITSQGAQCLEPNADRETSHRALRYKLLKKKN